MITKIGTVASVIVGLGIGVFVNKITTKSNTPTHSVVLTTPSKHSNIVLVVKDRGYYKVAYDEAKKCPLWVSYKMSPSDGKRSADRSDDKFYSDTDIKTASSSDYDKTGYDRGHMVASADMAFSEDAQKESFRMSNVCLQTPALNRGEWKKLETKVRSSAKKNVVYVSAGPIYDDSRKVINGILLPIAYWKVYKANDKIHSYICQNGADKAGSSCAEVGIDKVKELILDDTPLKQFK